MAKVKAKWFRVELPLSEGGTVPLPDYLWATHVQAADGCVLFWENGSLVAIYAPGTWRGVVPTGDERPA